MARPLEAPPEHRDPGEAALAMAVIGRAVDDVNTADRGWQFTSAGRFLLSTSGPWATSRERWAHMAGMDPDWIRRKVLEGLKAERSLLHGSRHATRFTTRLYDPQTGEAVDDEQPEVVRQISQPLHDGTPGPSAMVSP